MMSLAAFTLTACSGATLPEKGAVSAFDGIWEGTLPGKPKNAADCSGITLQGEVRFGHLVASIYQKKKDMGDVWGEIGTDGKLIGNVGALGIQAGTANVVFTETTASGDWDSPACTGTLQIAKK